MNGATESSPLYAWYGDDLTGSTDVLEGLAVHGLPAVLFLRAPDEEALREFAGCRAIGIAGESRSRTPEWMDANLPAIFAAMRKLGAPVNHYKVCSTFDSSPRTGSIGRAMELGTNAFASAWAPVVVGAPHLGRAVAFGNLFAAANGEMVRVDRHPTMCCHPVTPMREADLRVHLAQQTAMRTGLVDLTSLQSGVARQRLTCELAAGAKAVMFDGIDEATQEASAALVWEQACERPLFAVGSSGLTYGLLRHWQRLGIIGDAPVQQVAKSADRLLVLSGSCSAVTEKQIRRAQQQGFAAFALACERQWTVESRHATEALARGQSVVLYTALGAARGQGDYGEEFGAALGDLLREILLASGVRRVLVAGGDTATHAVSRLGLRAFTFAAQLAPGAPLCRGHAPGSTLDGLELVLKGGQIGPEDFFARVRDGSQAKCC